VSEKVSYPAAFSKSEDEDRRRTKKKVQDQFREDGGKGSGVKYKEMQGVNPLWVSKVQEKMQKC